MASERKKAAGVCLQSVGLWGGPGWGPRRELGELRKALRRPGSVGPSRFPAAPVRTPTR